MRSISTVCRHFCKFGQQLVSKKVFEVGTGGILLDEIMSLCMVTGWMNETIGGFTCTKDCPPPTNYSEVFTNDWTPGDETLKYSKVE